MSNKSNLFFQWLNKNGTVYKEGSHLYQSVARVLEALGYKTGNETVKSRPIIGVLWFSKTNKGGDFISDALELCKADGSGVDGLLIVTADGIKEDEVPFRESPILCTGKERIQICKATLTDMQNAVARFPEELSDSTIYRQNLAQVAATYAVFQPIGVAAGHGARNDVSNRILAPTRLSARLGATAPDIGDDPTFRSSDSLASCWQNFTKSFKKGETQLGKEFRFAAERFESAVKKAKNSSLGEAPKTVAKDLATAAETLMTLMTECRRNAGIVTEVTMVKITTKGKDCDFNLPQIPSGEKYRLLVVDDHWSAWEPVLNAVVARIKGANIDIVYSPDGKLAWREPGDQEPEKNLAPSVPILSAAFQADAILMDILLGDKENGLNVLEQIREYSESIPVILWTTTRSQEITNQAQRANGVILKKTCDPESFAGTLANWLQVGHNRRGVSLLNPFFDSVIKRPEYREYAREVTEWALKWMDGFAGMNDTFRIFTDHGGRHYVKILGFLERAVCRFLGNEKCVSLDYETRQQEMLALYLAVFCHEIGMFPLTGEISLCSNSGYAASMRTLHAPRGMVLLEDDSCQWWLDRDAGKKFAGREGDSFQEKFKNVRKKLAVLVGYHARFYSTMNENDAKTEDGFLNGVASKKREDAQKTADGLHMFRHDGGNETVENVFKKCVKKLDAVFSSTGDKDERDRLRFMSAMLRLCDAIDKDESRNPPKYLHSNGLFGDLTPTGKPEIVQNRETLKQLLFRKVEIHNGKINMTVAADKPSKADLDFCSVNGQPTVDDLTDPWNAFSAYKGNAEELNNRLEAYMKKIWIEIIEWQVPVSGEIASKLMTATALSGALEIIDEYTAVSEVGASEHLKLGTLTWAGEAEVKNQVLAELEKIGKRKPA